MLLAKTAPFYYTLRRHGLFFLLLAVASLVRFYNFPAWYGFDYDQEINAWIAKGLIVDHKLTLIGPETSTGGIFVGPYFNYVIALFFALARMDPAGTIALNGLISILTLTAFYRVAGKIFEPAAAKIAAAFYAFSAMIVGYDRVLWNPTPIPLVSLLAFYFLYCFLAAGRSKHLFLATVFLGLMFHLHFQAIIIAAVFFLALLIFKRRALLRPGTYLATLPVMFFFLLPLIVFDLRHNFLNSRHFSEFIFAGKSFAGGGRLFDPPAFLRILSVIIISLRDLIYNYSNRAIVPIVRLTMIFPAAAAVYLLCHLHHYFYRLCFLAMTVSLLAFSLYRGPLPTQYYFLFLYPLFILVVSGGLGKLAAKNQLSSLAVTLLLAVFAILNVWQIKDEKNDLSLANKHRAVAAIVQKAQGKSFKVDLITSPGLATGYKYLFWLEGTAPSFDYRAQTDQAYKIVVPAKLARPEELFARFGGIGVVKSN